MWWAGEKCVNCKLPSEKTNKQKDKQCLEQESIGERFVWNWVSTIELLLALIEGALPIPFYLLSSHQLGAVLWLTLRSMIKMVDTMAIVANVKVKFRINSSEMISLASHWMYIMQYAIGESKRLALRGLADISWSDMSKVISDRPVFKDC